MKVCMVGSDGLPLPSTYGGGVERHIWELSKNLAKHGTVVHLLTLPSKDHQNEEELEGVRIHRGMILHFVDRQFPYAHPSFDLYALVKSLDRSFDFDIIHAHNGPPGLAVLPSKFLGRKKLIFTEHTPYLIPLPTPPRVFGTSAISEHTPYLALLLSEARKRSIKLKILTASEAFVPKFASKVIAISSEVVDGLVKKVGIPHERIIHVPNGVDIDRFNPSVDGTKVKARLGLEDKKIMLFVGRVSGGKGVHNIVNALPTILESVPDVVFLIVGAMEYFSINGKFVPNRYYQYLLEIANRLRVRDKLIFTGPVHDDELPRYYAACDLFVLPSYHEGFSLVSAEALASGKPVIATRCGGVTDIVRDGYDGFLVPIGDEEALADRIITVLNDRRLARRLGENGRKLMEQNFTWESIAIKVKKVYEDVLNSH